MFFPGLLDSFPSSPPPPSPFLLILFRLMPAAIGMHGINDEEEEEGEAAGEQIKEITIFFLRFFRGESSQVFFTRCGL